MVASQNFGCFLRLRLKFYIVLFQTHYPTLTYPKTKENKIETEKIEPEHNYPILVEKKLFNNKNLHTNVYKGFFVLML